MKEKLAVCSNNQCRSTNLYYRVKSETYVCRRCGTVIEGKEMEKVHEDYMKQLKQQIAQRN